MNQEAKAHAQEHPELHDKDNIEPDKKSRKQSRGKHTVTLIIIAILFVLLAIFLYAVYSLIVSTTSISLGKDDSNCKGSEYCINIVTTYEDGWANWKIDGPYPPFFAFTAGTHTNGTKLLVTCPIKYTPGDNEFFSKLEFFFSKPDINKCVVNEV